MRPACARLQEGGSLATQTRDSTAIVGGVVQGPGGETDKAWGCTSQPLTSYLTSLCHSVKTHLDVQGQEVHPCEDEEWGGGADQGRPPLTPAGCFGV